MKLKCRILGHKLGWEIFEHRYCQRTGCDHAEPPRGSPPYPPSPSEVQNLKNNLSEIKATFEDLTALMVESLNDPDMKRTLPYPMIGKKYMTGPGSHIGALIRHFAYHIGMMITEKVNKIINEIDNETKS
ncbi:MAG: hypothetical protein GWP06_06070 [Actinobacteria bacterium]|nr:hypothetical protein [Actinomycetota bacterium]